MLGVAILLLAAMNGIYLPDATVEMPISIQLPKALTLEISPA